MMGKRYHEYINGWTYLERLRWFALAKCVRVTPISHICDNLVYVSYVARIHGIIIASQEGIILYETKEAARAAGKSVLALWKDEYARLIDSEAPHA